MGVEHAHEPGVAALVAAIGAALGVGGGQEEHIHPLDERAIVIVDRVAHQPLVDAIRQAAGVEAVLEVAVAPVIGRRHRALD